MAEPIPHDDGIETANAEFWTVGELDEVMAGVAPLTRSDLDSFPIRGLSAQQWDAFDRAIHE